LWIVITWGEERRGSKLQEIVCIWKTWSCAPKVSKFCFVICQQAPKERGIMRWFSSNLCFTFLHMIALCWNMKWCINCLSTWSSLIFQPSSSSILLVVPLLNLCTNKFERPLSMQYNFPSSWFVSMTSL